MAQIYTLDQIPISPSDYPGDEHRLFRMEFHPESIPNIGELIDWAKRQPRTGFGGNPLPEEFSCTIRVYYSNFVWLVNHSGDQTPRVDYVTVRTYTRAAADYFRKVWEIPSRVYEMNLEHLRRMENAKRGNIWIDGAYHPISDLMVKPKKTKKKRTK